MTFSPADNRSVSLYSSRKPHSSLKPVIVLRRLFSYAGPPPYSMMDVYLQPPGGTQAARPVEQNLSCSNTHTIDRTSHKVTDYGRLFWEACHDYVNFLINHQLESRCVLSSAVDCRKELADFVKWQLEEVDLFCELLLRKLKNIMEKNSTSIQTGLGEFANKFVGLFAR